METIGSLPKELNGTVHAPLGAWSGSADADGTEWTRGEIYSHATSLSDAYHVYAAEWKPGTIDFSIDGKVYFTINKAQMPASGRWTFDHPNHLLLNLAVGGEWPGSPTSRHAVPVDHAGRRGSRLRAAVLNGPRTSVAGKRLPASVASPFSRGLQPRPCRRGWSALSRSRCPTARPGTSIASTSTWSFLDMRRRGQVAWDCSSSCW